MKIEEISAFVSVDEFGHEGVCAWFNPHNKTWLPLIGADHERIESLRGLARQLARESGQRIVLRKFTVATDLEEILP